MSLKNLAQVLVAACLIAITWTSVGMPTAKAQESASKQLVTLHLESVGASDALRQLFDTNNVSYSIDPRIDTTVAVNLRLNNVPFELALQNICKQAGISYRVEAGVYQLVSTKPNIDFSSQAAPFAEPPLPLAVAPRPGTDVAITQDDHFLYVVRGLQVYKLEKSSLKVLNQTMLPPPDGQFQGFPGRRPMRPTPPAND